MRKAKPTRLLLYGAIVAASLAATNIGFAQTASGKPEGVRESVFGANWSEWYTSYSANPFTLMVPLTPSNIECLKSRTSLFSYRLLYLNSNNANNTSTPMLYVGFFPSEAKAKEFLQASQFLFKGQLIRRVPEAEFNGVVEATKNQNDYIVFAIAGKNTEVVSHSLDRLLEQAKNYYMDKRYSEALTIYKLLGAFADPNTAAWAMELEGLSYEKMKQHDKALEAYRVLLATYPDSSGSVRVEQRMRGLATAAEDGNESRRKSSYADNKNDILFRGNIGQFQRSLFRSVNDGEDEEVLSLLTTDFDFRASGRIGSHNLIARLGGYWKKDSIDEEDSETRLKRVFVEYQNQKYGTEVTLGRQRESNAGVFGSFDGVNVTQPVADGVSVGVTVGEPVYFNDIYKSLDYSFMSTNADWKINQNWYINSYYIQQELENVTDRQAFGIRTQYADAKLFGSINIDYDTAFSELNNLLLSVNYTISQKHIFSLIYGQQRSPFLTATNILIGQPDLDLPRYLESKENQDSLLDDAFARTSLNTYYSFTYSSQLTKDSRVVFDVYQSSLTEMPSFEELAGLPITSEPSSEFTQTATGFQFIAQNALMEGDSANFGIRYGNGETTNSARLYISEKIRIGNWFSFQPKLQYTRLNVKTSDDVQSQFRYSAILTYKPFKNTELNLEAGNESISYQNVQNEFNSHYLFFGYRVHF